MFSTTCESLVPQEMLTGFLFNTLRTLEDKTGGMGRVHRSLITGRWSLVLVANLWLSTSVSQSPARRSSC